MSIVWIGPDTVKVYHFSEDRMERESLSGAAEPKEQREWITSRVRESSKILLLSPGGERGERFFEILSVEVPGLAKRIVGREVLEQALDPEIADYAIRYFRKPVTIPG